MPGFFEFEFMQRALLAGLAVGLIAPVIGSFLVVRRQSFFADTLAHMAFLGVAIGAATSTFPLLTAVLTSALGALAMAYLYIRNRVFPEAILVVFLYGSLSLAVIIMSLSQSFNTGVLAILFGSLLTVQPEDLYIITVLGAVTLIIITLLYKELFFISFDEEVARASGVPVKVLTVVLMVLAAIVVSLSIRIVGALLIGALMTIPVIAAMQYRMSFKSTIFAAVIFSLVSVFAGLALSFYLGLASGGTIALISLALFLISMVVKPRN